MLKQRILNLFLKIAFVFEPLAPIPISYYINQKLKEIQKIGLISNFHKKIKRLGRFHYLIIIDLELNSNQTDYVIKRMLPELTRINKFFNR